VTDDAVRFWLDSSGRVPRLTPAEEVHLGGLIRAWQDWQPSSDDAPAPVKRRGLRARDRMVSANLRLVAHVTRLMRPGLGLLIGESDLPDLLQAGAIGLMRGAERFDPERGYKFSTFGYWWIRQGLSRWCDSSSRTIRLPTTHGPKLARLGRVGAMLTNDLGRQPTNAELAAALGMKLDDLNLVFQVGAPCRSLDQAHGDIDNPSSLGELLAAPGAEEQSPDVEELHERIAGLDPIQQRLIAARWGLTCPPMSYAQLASQEAISIGEVKLMLGKAMRKLRREPEPVTLPPPALTPWRAEECCQLSLSIPIPPALP
jgi:RNA polymerase primary sigma factor